MTIIPGITMIGTSMTTSVISPYALPRKGKILPRDDINYTRSGTQPGVTARFEMVTPDRAAIWLADWNKVNRRLRDIRSDLYGQDMKEGLWALNGDTFVFDSDGQMVNGQHRAEGIVKSGETIECLVVRGVRPDVRPTTDDVIRRAFRDDLSMSKEDNSGKREVLTRMMLQWDTYAGLTGSFRPSRKQLAVAYRRYADEQTRVIHETIRWWNIRDMVNRNAMMFAYWLLRYRLGYDEGLVTHFFSVLAIGSQAPEDQVIIRVKRRVQKPAGYAKSGNPVALNAGTVAWWLLRGWSYWVAGHQGKLFGPDGGVPANPFPKPLDPAVKEEGIND